MDSLQDLLGKYGPKEPEEIQIIKRYIDDHFKMPATVAVRDDSIVITVQSAALANTLRFHTSKLRVACDTTKKILLRIA